MKLCIEQNNVSFRPASRSSDGDGLSLKEKEKEESIRKELS